VVTSGANRVGVGGTSITWSAYALTEGHPASQHDRAGAARAYLFDV
jgi:hypothetical protein